MKKQELNTFLTRTDLLDEFTLRGKLIYLPLVSPMLRGIYFNDSGFNPKAFYPIVFVQPLFVPLETLVFTFSKEIPSNEGLWRLDAPGIGNFVKQAKKITKDVFEELGSPTQFEKNWKKYSSSKNPHVLHAVAFNQLWLEKPLDFNKFIDEAIGLCREGNQIGWMKKMEQELESMKSKAQEDVVAARNELVEITENQIRQFKLKSANEVSSRFGPAKSID